MRESKRCLSAVRFVSFMEDFQRARFDNGQFWLSRKQTHQCMYVEVIKDFSIFPSFRIWHFFSSMCKTRIEADRSKWSGSIKLNNRPLGTRK